MNITHGDDDYNHDNDHGKCWMESSKCYHDNHHNDQLLWVRKKHLFQYNVKGCYRFWNLIDWNLSLNSTQLIQPLNPWIVSPWQMITIEIISLRLRLLSYVRLT